jgi:hypothetical protein
MPNYETPDPAVILERFAAVTGTEVLAAGNIPASIDLVYGMRPQAIDHADVVLMNDTRPVGMAPIGHYDPATNKWRWPEEYVRPHEQPPLTDLVRRQLYPLTYNTLFESMIHTGGEGFDPQHDLTRGVRREAANVLAPLNPISWLGRAGVREQLLGNGREEGALVAADDYTITYPTLIAAGFERNRIIGGGLKTTIKNEKLNFSDGSLVLSFAGVKVQSSLRRGGTVRSTRGLALAHRDPNHPAQWLPNLQVISAAEWEELRVLPQIIASGVARNTRFSPEHCGVVHNLKRQDHR